MSIIQHATGPKTAHRPVAHTQETITTQLSAEESVGSGFGEAVEIQLSEAAAEELDSAKPGKSGSSPAQLARDFLAEFTSLFATDDGGEGGEGGKVPFGQIVSRIARGIDPAEAFAAPPVEEPGTTEGTEAAAEGTVGETVEETAEKTAGTTPVDGAVAVPEVESGEAIVAELLDELLESGEDDQTSA